MDPHVWQVMVDAFPQLLFKGITVTIPLTIISFALSMVIAVVVALIQYSKVPVLRQICRFYVWVIRGTPLLVQLYVVFFGLPSIGIMVDAFLAAVIVFSINEGAYNAETIRGALSQFLRARWKQDAASASIIFRSCGTSFCLRPLELRSRPWATP